MLEWDDLRVLLAVARHGSLTAAARTIGVTQPTMSRRVEGLESRLGAPLFERQASGVALTALGTSLLDMAEQMEDAAMTVERRIAARGTGLDGLVRVTTLEWIGQHVLAPVLARFARLHPGLVVELLATERLLNLARHEADIAIRTARFDQDGLVQRRLRESHWAVYAGEAYLAEWGEPDFGAGCPGHALLLLPEAQAAKAQLNWLRDEAAPRARIALQSNNIDVLAAASVAGAGLVMLPRLVGDAIGGLRRLHAPGTPPRRELWLGYHEDLRHTPRVRALTTFIAAEMT